MGLLVRKVKNLFNVLKRLTNSNLGMIGMTIITLWIVVALLGPIIAPYAPTAYHPQDRFSPPTWKYPFGTDRFGRDMFSRVVLGSRSVLILASSATALSLVLGSSIGLITGFLGGVVDEAVMRFMDILMSFPALLFAMLILGIFGPSSFGVITVIGLVYAPRIARVARSAVLEVKQKEFIEAAKVRGESKLYIMFVELLPNIWGPLGVEASVRFGYAIFLSASLGFLGLGVQPPTPDWGLLMKDAQSYITMAPWMAIFPALAIASLVVAVNFLADAIRKYEAGEL
ncbi:MAG: ABC transporter permease [Candidatus Bipolaricaulota bacterium]|nr:ABC transporter permease [Candidatus Bipolaricaulota bacterium]